MAAVQRALVCLASVMGAASGPSLWVSRFASLVPPGGRVLDVACGAGRQTRFFLPRGHPVTAVDRDTNEVRDLRSDAGAEIVEFDLEAGAPFLFRGREFAGVVVANYLQQHFMPLLADRARVAIDRVLGGSTADSSRTATLGDRGNSWPGG